MATAQPEQSTRNDLSFHIPSQDDNFISPPTVEHVPVD